jgi:hypothetical protein
VTHRWRVVETMSDGAEARSAHQSEDKARALYDRLYRDYSPLTRRPRKIQLQRHESDIWWIVEEKWA